METPVEFSFYEYKKEFDCSYRQLAEFGKDGWELKTTFSIPSMYENKPGFRICYLFMRVITGERRNRLIADKLERKKLFDQNNLEYPEAETTI